MSPPLLPGSHHHVTSPHTRFRPRHLGDIVVAPEGRAGREAGAELTFFPGAGVGGWGGDGRIIVVTEMQSKLLIYTARACAPLWGLGQ